MGAIASGGTVVTKQSIVQELGISPEVIEVIAKRERPEIERREGAYRDGRLPIPVEGRTAILIDDGLATGASMLAAARALRPRARRVIAAVPVASETTCNELSGEVDQIICATTPQPFFAVACSTRRCPSASLCPRREQRCQCARSSRRLRALPRLDVAQLRMCWRLWTGSTTSIRKLRGRSAWGSTALIYTDCMRRYGRSWIKWTRWTERAHSGHAIDTRASITLGKTRRPTAIYGLRIVQRLRR